MELRTIKTCQGFQEFVLLDGALMPPDFTRADLNLAWSPTAQTWVLPPELSPTELAELGALISQAYLERLPAVIRRFRLPRP